MAWGHGNKQHLFHLIASPGFYWGEGREGLQQLPLKK